jgi:hypothetical protein
MTTNRVHQTFGTAGFFDSAYSSTITVTRTAVTAPKLPATSLSATPDN